MSARFIANFLVLLLGAGLVVTTFAFSTTTADWVGVGAGSAATLVALVSFALPQQGAYQRIADVVICAVGAWAIVAAIVLTPGGRWLEFSAGAGLAALGAIGLVVREVGLATGLQVGQSVIGPDGFAQHGAATARRGSLR
jgi:hypothetical protein